MFVRCSIVAASLLASSSALAQVTLNAELDGPPEKYAHVLPFFGKKIAERGVQLPLPLGINLGYVYTDQGVDINELELSLGTFGPENVDEFIRLEGSKVRLHAIMARVDIWLLPFLNVYYLGTFVPAGETDVGIVAPVETTGNAKFTGIGNGFGLTAAFGINGFWLSGDFNLSWFNSNLEDTVSTVGVIGVRMGYEFRFGKGMALSPWSGFMWQSFGGITQGQGQASDFLPPLDWDNVRGACDDLNPGSRACNALVDQLEDSELSDAPLGYSMRKKPTMPFNPLIGLQYQLNQHWYFRAEMGFGSKWNIVAMVNYRFGFRLAEAGRRKKSKRQEASSTAAMATRGLMPATPTASSPGR